MTLPAAGNPISLSQVNTELGYASNAFISLSDLAVRNLFGKPSGAIALSDGYGKGVSIGNFSGVAGQSVSGSVILTGYASAAKYTPSFGSISSVANPPLPAGLTFPLVQLYELYSYKRLYVQFDRASWGAGSSTDPAEFSSITVNGVSLQRSLATFGNYGGWSAGSYVYIWDLVALGLTVPMVNGSPFSGAIYA